jgi:two-component system chemotaxis response regulator CheY
MDITDLTVMLVEPSLTQQRIVENYLHELGITTVDRFNRGHQALAEIRRSAPDLVISSLYLPDMTGTELVYAMREDDTLLETAFLLISSEIRFRYLDPIRQAGAIAILPKPFDKEDLRIALQSTLDYIEVPQLQLKHIDTEALQVLVVDDSRISRNHIHRILEAMDIEHIHEAVNGAAGLQMINQHYYDLVISDYHMPEMDGGELVEHIRSNSAQPGLPILMVTSESNQRRLTAVQKAGVSAICDKPFEPTTLKRFMESILLET